jgi:mannose-6-phosphate isomerase
MAMYPLKFKPRYVQKMWGGTKLATILHKSPPPGSIGESWEIYDFPPGVVDGSADWISSEVAGGPLAGKTLHELITTSRRELLGDIAPLPPHGQFPLLIKFLDAREDLSVQVHPDEAYAKANPGAHLKNEAWYIVQADAGSRILKGLKPGVTRNQFAQAVEKNSMESAIESITVKPGDCFYLPSGTVHALGAGILAAEVQTPSDTTYRVHDFNRVDPSTGKLRTLHVQKAMNCIDFSQSPPAKSSGPELAKCEQFSIRKVEAQKGKTLPIAGDEPIILMIISGSGEFGSTPFAAGDTVLLPASLGKLTATFTAESTWLQIGFYPR